MLNQDFIGKVIQFHIDAGDPETFIVGQLVWVDEKWFLVRSISTSGKWDGIALYLQSDIVSVQTDGDYIQKMIFLLKHRNQNPSAVPNISNNPLIDLFTYAKETNRIVGLELCMSGYRDVIGFVHVVYDHTVCIQQVDEYGKPDGISFVSDSAVTRCFIDDEELMCLNLLAERHSNTSWRYDTGDGSAC